MVERLNPPWLNSELLLQTLYNCEWNAKSSLERAGGAPSTRAGPPRSIHGGSNLQSGGGWEGIASGGDPPRTWPHRPRHDEARGRTDRAMRCPRKCGTAARSPALWLMNILPSVRLLEIKL